MNVRVRAEGRPTARVIRIACLVRRCASAWTAETMEYRLTQEKDM